MKALKKLTYVLLGASLTFAGCEKYTDGFEKDPNNPADADAVNMIQGVMLADIFFQTGELARLAGMWSNQFTGEDRQYIALDTWEGAPAATFDGAWGVLYAGVVANSRIVQEKTTATKNFKLRGVAKVLEAHGLGTATALWGDIPNEQAANVEEFPNPEYDSQLSVYADVQQKLSTAIEDLQDLGSIPAEKDILYAGDASKWIKLAHALKARFYLHTEEYALAETHAAMAMQSMADDLLAPFGAIYNGNFNPYYSFLVYDRAGYMGAGDAYAPRLLDPAAPEYRGNDKTGEHGRFYWNYHDFGIYAPTYEPNFLNGFDWRAKADGRFGNSMPLVTYGEMLLIMAEAQLRQGELEEALATYNAYRTYLRTVSPYFGASAAVYEVPSLYEDYVMEDFAAGGIENAAGNVDATTAFLREILEERYVHFIGDYEAFNDIRRTDNLIGVPVKGGGDMIAQRFLYPQTEINANSNVPTPVPGYDVPTEVNED